MAPSNSKTNFKSFEVQARLLRAIVAAHPDVKWNYKEIRNCFGSDLTDNIMGHRMRHIRTQAAIIRRGLDAGLDPKHMPVADSFFPKDQNKIDDNICKYFGDSTPDGIQFQFRSIKKDAHSLRAAADNGEDPSAALSFTAGTPSSKRSPTKLSTPGTARSTATVQSTGGRKRKSAVKPEPSEDEASEEVDYKARDLTPTPAPRPTKRAKAANGHTVDLTSESEDSASTPVTNSLPSSLPTEDVKPAFSQSQSYYDGSFETEFDVDLSQSALDSFYPVGEI